MRNHQISDTHISLTGKMCTVPLNTLGYTLSDKQNIYVCICMYNPNHQSLKNNSFITKILMYYESVDSHFHAALWSCRERFTCQIYSQSPITQFLQGPITMHREMYVPYSPSSSVLKPRPSQKTWLACSYCHFLMDAVSSVKIKKCQKIHLAGERFSSQCVWFVTTHLQVRSYFAKSS